MRAVAVEIAADDLLQNVLGQARHAGVVEQRRAAVAAWGRARRWARSGCADRGTCRGAVLVIFAPPTPPPIWSCQPPPVVSACSRRSTSWNSSRWSGVRPIMRSITAMMTAPRMLEVPEAAALGNADQRGQLDAAAELLEHVARASCSPGQSAISGEKPEMASAALARAKRSPGPAVIEQFCEIADFEVHAAVDRTQPDHRLVDHAAVAVDGRLAVEVDRGVDDVAAVFERVGGRVGPAAAELDARRRAAPDGFVGAQGVARARLRGASSCAGWSRSAGGRRARAGSAPHGRRGASAVPANARCGRRRNPRARRRLPEDASGPRRRSSAAHAAGSAACAQGVGQVLGREGAVARPNMRRSERRISAARMRGAAAVEVVLIGQHGDLGGAVAVGGEPGALLLVGRRGRVEHPQPAADSPPDLSRPETRARPTGWFGRCGSRRPPRRAIRRAAARRNASSLKVSLDAVTADEPARRAVAVDAAEHIETGAGGQRQRLRPRPRRPPRCGRPA